MSCEQGLLLIARGFDFLSSWFPWEMDGGVHSADEETKALGPLDGQPPVGGAGGSSDLSPHGLCVLCPQCSTTCGLGAVWRPVRCSSGREEDCIPAGRPQPARRCHLRPCAAWHTGNWSKVRGHGEGGRPQAAGWSPGAHGLSWDQPQPPVRTGEGSVLRTFVLEFLVSFQSLHLREAWPTPSLLRCLWGFTFSLFLSSICPLLGQPLARPPAAQG